MNVGDKVWFRGKFAKNFSIRGTIEVLNDGYSPEAPIGVRLESGNFVRAAASQVKERREGEGP